MEKMYCLKNIYLPNLRLVLTLILGLALFSKAYSQNVPSPDMSAEEAYARGAFKKVETGARYMNALDNLLEIEKLPIGQVREINGHTYVAVIDNAYAKTDKAFVSAYFQFTIPGTTEELIFGVKEIAFNPGGFGLSDNTKLVLLNNKRIPLNEHVELVLSGGGDNYVEWGCDGFKSVHLQGDFEFDQGWITPVEAGQDKVKVSVTIQANDLNNILAAVSIPAFKITGLNDFSFKVTNAVVDLSDMANPEGLTVSNDMMPVPGSPLSWRGFYLGTVEVGLPSQLSASRGRPKVSVQNFYIDDQGVSGTVTAANVAELGDAGVGGWPISITELSLIFSKNRLNGGGLGGAIKIGFLGEEPLSYSATVEMRNDDTYYNFSLTTNADKTYQFFAGEITVGQNSRIAVTKDQNGFLASATLNGNVSLSKGPLSISQIGFQNLMLSSQSPYVHGGTFEIANNRNSKIANFPIGIDSLKLAIFDGKVGFGGTVRLSFMNREDKGFAATTSFMVTAKRREETTTIRVNEADVTRTTTHWELDKVDIGDIALDIKIAAFTLKGSIALFKNHSVYGDGFKGSLLFSIPGPVPSASAIAYFGSKDDYRYWHVDAYVGAKFPLCPALDVTGLMGGLTYRMKKPEQIDYYKARQAADDNGGLNALTGTSESFAYVPDKTSGYGFMAGVSVATKVETVLNANVILEIAFAADGGLRTIEFKGAGYVMNNVKKAIDQAGAAEDHTAPIWVNFRMLYSNVTETFDASIKTYVNVLSGVLKGKGEHGLAGEAALHIAPREWYFYIGRPSQMFGLSALGLAEINAYFMMGSKIEDMPPPPARVNKILGKLAATTSAAKTGMQAGSGLGFGAHFETKFSFDYFVYGEFAVGAGADILLRNYGENARCKGGSTIGVNGWYASGQAYAYLQGEVGIRVKVFGSRKSFKIVDLAAAALLEAKLPNPSWFKGQAGVRYSVLGGLISGSASVSVELGSKCEIIGGRELDIQVISDIKPDNNSRDVSVFASPQVSFNIPVDKPFAMMNNEDKVATYRVKLSQFTLKDDKGASLQGSMTVNAEGSAATISTNDILPSTTKLTAFASIALEKQEGNNNWSPLGGAQDYETKSAEFTTGAAPDYIPWENVLYTYPIKRQYNFLPKEYNKGYIKLNQGMPDLFKTVEPNGKRWAFKASFTPVSGVPVVSNVSFEGNSQVNFDIPENLAKETIYNFSLVRTSLDGERAANNVATTENTTYAPTDTTTISKKSLKGVAASGIEKELIAIPLRTSMYGTFREKMEGITSVRNISDLMIDTKTIPIGQNFHSSENFDQFELGGEGTIIGNPLIVLKAGTGSGWLQNTLMPYLYNGYPFHPTLKFESKYEKFRDGAVPLYAIFLYNNDNDSYKLEDTSLAEGLARRHTGSCRFMYYVHCTANYDYNDLYKQVHAQVLQNLPNPNIQRIVNQAFPQLAPNQEYPVELQYRIPGKNIITSTVVRNISFR